MYFFICQDCGSVVSTPFYDEYWLKFHQSDNSCPSCSGDMCGGSCCIDEALEVFVSQDEPIKIDEGVYLWLF